MEPQYLETRAGKRIAYHKSEARMLGPDTGLVFLGGFRSDMEGTKALFLEDCAMAEGRAFLRFDYSGHGSSSGAFLDGCIGEWAQDAMEVIATLTEGPQILVGSSMGGWISLLIARAMPEKVAGLVTIAAAPDFTEDGMWDSFTPAEKAALEADGQVALSSEYSDEPFIITRRLIEDGRDQLVLRDPLPLPFPVRFLQGTADEDVDMSVALRLLEHAQGDDIRLTLVKGGDHRFSTPENLILIRGAIHSLKVH